MASSPGPVPLPAMEKQPEGRGRTQPCSRIRHLTAQCHWHLPNSSGVPCSPAWLLTAPKAGLGSQAGMGRSIGRRASAVVSRGDSGWLGPPPHTGSKPGRLPGHGPSKRPFTTVPTWHNSRLREKPLGARGPMAQVLREGPAAPCEWVQCVGVCQGSTAHSARSFGTRFTRTPGCQPLRPGRGQLGPTSPNSQSPTICYICTPLARSVWGRKHGESLAPAGCLSCSQKSALVRCVREGGCCVHPPRAGVRAERAGRRHEDGVSGQAPRAP